MAFYANLVKISLEEYKRRLKEEYLLPSQQILKESTDKHFEAIASQGIVNLAELKKALKTKKNLQDFVAATGIPEEYVTILRREVQSHHPSLRKLKDFGNISSKLKSKLEGLGYKTTCDLYDYIKTVEQRKSLAAETGTTGEEILLLARFCDFTRIRYVNSTFALWLTFSKYDTAEKLQKADPEELHLELNQINKEKKFMKNSLGLNDMKLLIRDTRDIDFEIEY